MVGLSQSCRAREKANPGVGFDNHYLENFIQRQGRQISILDHATSIHDNPRLLQFAILWRSVLNRQLKDALELQHEGGVTITRPPFNNSDRSTSSLKGFSSDEEFLLLAYRMVENQTMEIELVYCQA